MRVAFPEIAKQESDDAVRYHKLKYTKLGRRQKADQNTILKTLEQVCRRLCCNIGELFKK